MESLRRSAPWVVAAVLAVAASVFLVRSVVESGEDRADAPDVVSSTASASTGTPSASASPSASPSPSASASASPSPSPTKARKTKEPEPAPTVPAFRSTASVEWLIKGRLDTQGPATAVVCPESVSTRVGTTYTCAVAYASAPSKVVADAFVRVTSTSGTVTWSSTPR